MSSVRAELIEPGADPVDRLAERVQEHFKAAVKRGYRTPDIEGCRELARYLEAIRDWPQFRPDAEMVAEIKRDRKVVRNSLVSPDPEVSAVITLGNGFLSAFFALAPKLDAILADWEDPRAVETLRRSCDEVLSHMIEVMVLLKANLAPAKHWLKAYKALPTPALLALLARFTGERIPDTIQIVAALARQAWAKANRVPPKSNEKTAPLCKFVTAALSEIGIHTTPETVASILQGRRHRNKLVDRIDSIHRALQR